MRKQSVSSIELLLTFDASPYTSPGGAASNVSTSAASSRNDAPLSRALCTCSSSEAFKRISCCSACACASRLIRARSGPASGLGKCVWCMWCGVLSRAGACVRGKLCVSVNANRTSRFPFCQGASFGPPPHRKLSTASVIAASVRGALLGLCRFTLPSACR